MKQPTNAEVIHQLAKTAEEVPNAPLAYVLLPAIVTHMGLDLGITKAQALDMLSQVWDTIEPVFPALREKIAKMQASGENFTTEDLADAGDRVFLEHLPRKGAPS